MTTLTLHNHNSTMRADILTRCLHLLARQCFDQITKTRRPPLAELQVLHADPTVDDPNYGPYSVSIIIFPDADAGTPMTTQIGAAIPFIQDTPLPVVIFSAMNLHPTRPGIIVFSAQMARSNGCPFAGQTILMYDYSIGEHVVMSELNPCELDPDFKAAIPAIAWELYYQYTKE